MKIGIQELLVVFIVALIVIGPDKLPMYAKKLGTALAQFRKFSEDATKDIRESIVEPLEEAQRPLREAMEPITELEESVKSNVKDIQQSFADIGRPKKPAAPSAEKETLNPEKETGSQSAQKENDLLEEPAASGSDETSSGEQPASSEASEESVREDTGEAVS